MLTGGRLLVDCLLAQGVDRVFCVPGESYLPVLDALYQQPIETIVARQEGAAAMMAEADGKLTGRPGIAFVTRGPGATNASSGVHVAMQDGTPLILFVGQIDRGVGGREAFQEVDYRQMFGKLAKWTDEITDAARIPEILSHAFHVAMNGRPGPVVLALPEDMLRERVDAAPGPRVSASPIGPVATDVERFAAWTDAAERPVLILGGSRWDAAATIAIAEYAHAAAIPVAVSFRRQQLFDHTDANYAGDVGIGANPALVQRLRSADLVILLGARMSENPSQNFDLFDIPSPHQQLVHILNGAEELGRIYHADLAINASPLAFVTALPAPAVAHIEARATAVIEAHRDYIAWSDPEPTHTVADETVDMRRVVRSLNVVLPADAIVTNGAGNYASWLHRFYAYEGLGTQLAPTSGSMGYGLPAAIAAKRRFPDRTVVCLAGDGCFQMTGMELGTAVQAAANVIVIVIDNASYGTIRMHQERDYPRRVIATTLENPDFADLARAFGAHGQTVRSIDDFEPALRRAMNCGRAALIHVHTDPEHISPATTITALRG
jgi:acetolactate synthase-1/2/3 large subunit